MWVFFVENWGLVGGLVGKGGGLSWVDRDGGGEK